MDTNFFTDDLSQLDQHSLEKIAHIAQQARQSLLVGIASLRHLDASIQPLTPDAVDSNLMVEQLSRLTLMWDEIHHRANQLLTAELFTTDDWQSFHKPGPKTLH